MVVFRNRRLPSGNLNTSVAPKTIDPLGGETVALANVGEVGGGGDFGSKIALELIHRPKRGCARIIDRAERDQRCQQCPNHHSPHGPSV